MLSTGVYKSSYFLDLFYIISIVISMNTEENFSDSVRGKLPRN